MKTFSPFEKRAILNVAKSVQPLKNKWNTLAKKIADAEAEQKLLELQIASIENTITGFTNGMVSSQLVDVVPTQGGATKYLFKFPDTIMPPVPEVGEGEIANSPGPCHYMDGEDIPD